MIFLLHRLTKHTDQLAGQYALYFLDVREPDQDTESLHKSLMIEPDMPFTHAQLFLTPSIASKANWIRRLSPVDMAARMLESFAPVEPDVCL